MKNIILFALVSTFAMSGFFNDVQIEQAKAHDEESARLCKIYTEKRETYKATMRDDQFAEATLKNYVRLESKYCNTNNS